MDRQPHRGYLSAAWRLNHEGASSRTREELGARARRKPASEQDTRRRRNDAAWILENGAFEWSSAVVDAQAGDCVKVDGADAGYAVPLRNGGWSFWTSQRAAQGIADTLEEAKDAVERRVILAALRRERVR